MQFYWIRRPDGLLCSSESGVVQALIGRPAIDWEFVSNSLAYINLRTERTGFSAIRELLPGTCLCFDGVALSVEPTWLPGKHILCQRSGEVAGIANELQRLIINCTAAWSASRSQILVELSGGLDSSIVTAALKSADADFSAITFATPDAEGDERVYARAVAARCGIALAEVEHDDHRSEEHTSELQSLMRISYAVFCLKKKKKLN